MKRMQKAAVLILSLILGVGMTVHAQDQCTTLVQRALDQVDRSCVNTEGGQACYGNIQIDYIARETAQSFSFEAPGDITDLLNIRDLTLSSMDTTAVDEESWEWGISLMEISVKRTPNPDEPPESLEMLLFGNVAISDRSDEVNGSAVYMNDERGVTMRISVKNATNVRAAPASTADLTVELAARSVALADGRTSAGDWLRIRDSETGTPLGWVFTELVTLSPTGDETVEDLNVVEAALPLSPVTYAPMQAFFIQTGVDDSPCEAAPNSGILIQTQEGPGTIRLSANEVLIDIGSTIYLQANWSTTAAVNAGELTVSVVEGMAVVTAGGESVAVPQGTQTTVTLDNSGLPEANATPAPPQPYVGAPLAPLPVTVLTDVVPISPPLTPEQLDAFNSAPLPGQWQLTFDQGAVSCGADGPSWEYPNHEITIGGSDTVLDWSSDLEGEIEFQAVGRSFTGGSTQTITADDGSTAVFRDSYTMNINSPTLITGEIFASATVDGALACPPHVNRFTARYAGG